MFSREVVGNVESPEKSISRRLLFFVKFSYENGPYRVGICRVINRVMKFTL